MRGRVLVAIFALACRKSSRTPRASYALHAAQWLHAYISHRHRISVHTCTRYQPMNPLLSRVGGGDISTHRRAWTGSCSSPFPHLA